MEKYPEIWKDLTEKIGWKQRSDPATDAAVEDGELGEEQQDELLEIMSGHSMYNRGKLFDVDRRVDA